MTETLNPATRFMLLDRLAKRVKTAADAAKAELDKGMLPGDRTGVSLPLNGEPVVLGAVTRPKPTTKWVVTDEAALLAWVKEDHPERIEMVPQIREWYVKSLLDNAAANGAPITDEGEIVPGIGQKTGSSYISPKPEKDVDSLIEKLAAGGAVSIAGLLALEAGQS